MITRDRSLRAMKSILRATRSILYLLFPIAAVLLALPLSQLRPIDATTALVVAPFHLALLAAPGYVFCWARNARARTMGAVARWWVRLSLLAALMASVGGMLGAYWMVLFFPPSLATAVVVLLLWRRFEGADHAAASAVRAAGPSALDEPAPGINDCNRLHPVLRVVAGLIGVLSLVLGGAMVVAADRGGRGLLVGGLLFLGIAIIGRRDLVKWP